MVQEIKSQNLNAAIQPEPDLLEATFDFWYNDSGHIRSPFPLYIREELKVAATKKFGEWTASLTDKVKKEINDEIVAEKLEEIIFEAALKLVLTEDEKLTILYPFLPRLGDSILQKEKQKDSESKVTDRSLTAKGDFKFMKVKLKNIFTQENWETDFELPA